MSGFPSPVKSARTIWLAPMSVTFEGRLTKSPEPSFSRTRTIPRGDPPPRLFPRITTSGLTAQASPTGLRRSSSVPHWPSGPKSDELSSPSPHRPFGPFAVGSWPGL